MAYKTSSGKTLTEIPSKNIQIPAPDVYIQHPEVLRSRFGKTAKRFGFYLDYLCWPSGTLDMRSHNANVGIRAE